MGAETGEKDRERGYLQEGERGSGQSRKCIAGVGGSRVSMKRSLNKI